VLNYLLFEENHGPLPQKVEVEKVENISLTTRALMDLSPRSEGINGFEPSKLVLMPPKIACIQPQCLQKSF
jgi:hypothetical protein